MQSTGVLVHHYSLEKWQNIFPRAQNFNIVSRDFEPQWKLLPNIKCLRLAHVRIAPESFADFISIKSLEIVDCSGFDGNSLRHLSSINSLAIPRLLSFGDADIENLTTLETFKMGGCWQKEMTGAAFQSLPNITSLDISYCGQTSLFEFLHHLKRLKTLIMEGCYHIEQYFLNDLPDLTTLNLRECEQVTDDWFPQLSTLTNLDISGCKQITDHAFVHVQQLRVLNISNCGLFMSSDFVIPLTNLISVRLFKCSGMHASLRNPSSPLRTLQRTGCCLYYEFEDVDGQPAAKVEEEVEE